MVQKYKKFIDYLPLYDIWVPVYMIGGVVEKKDEQFYLMLRRLAKLFILLCLFPPPFYLSFHVSRFACLSCFGYSL